MGGASTCYRDALIQRPGLRLGLGSSPVFSRPLSPTPSRTQAPGRLGTLFGAPRFPFSSAALYSR